MNRILQMTLGMPLLATTVAFGQAVVSLPATGGLASDTILADITVSGFTNVVGVELHIVSDPAVAVPLIGTVSDYLAGATVGPAEPTNQINIIWEDFSNPLTVTDGAVLLQVPYVLVGEVDDSCTLSFTGSVLVDEAANEIPTTWNEGSIAITPPMPPEAFTLLSPTDEAVLTSTTVDFSWEVAVNDNMDPQLYDLYLSSDVDMTDVTLEINDIEGTSYQVSEDLVDGETYYWTVFAQDVDTDGTWATDTWQFTLAVPDCPVVDTPIPDVNGEEDTPITVTALLGHFSDPDGDDLSVASVTDDSGEEFGYDYSTANLVVTPPADWNGSTTVTVTVSDGSCTVSDEFELTLAAVNDAPVIELVTGPHSACGEVEVIGWGDDATEGFFVDADNGSLYFVIDDVDNATVTVSVYVNDTMVGSEPVGVPATDYLPHNIFNPEDYLDQDITFYVTISDGESVWNAGGEECSHALNFLAVEGLQPTEFYLAQNLPNPFNPTTVIEFGLPQASDVRLTVYNLAGEEVAVLLNRNMAAGEHHVTWNANQAASGLYVYTLQSDFGTQVRKMTLLR